MWNTTSESLWIHWFENLTSERLDFEIYNDGHNEKKKNDFWKLLRTYRCATGFSYSETI